MLMGMNWCRSSCSNMVLHQSIMSPCRYICDGHLVIFGGISNLEVLLNIPKEIFKLLRTSGSLKSLWLGNILSSGLHRCASTNSLLEDIDFILLILNSVLQHLHCRYYVHVGGYETYLYISMKGIYLESDLLNASRSSLNMQTSNNAMRLLRASSIWLK